MGKMHSTSIIAFSILLSVPILAEPTSGPHRQLHLPAKFLAEFVRPATADEAASYVVSLMSADERQLFLSTPEDALIRFHIGLGTGIRNRFGLWSRNMALRDSMGFMHPDDMSAEIIRRVWQKVRSDAGRDAVARIDALERTLRRILLPNQNYEWSDSPLRDKHRSTTVESLVADMNTAADDFFSREDSRVFTRVRLEAVGVGPARIWIRSGRFLPMSETLAPQSFAELLGQLGPPFGRFLVLYESPFVRIFASDAKEPNSERSAAP